MELEKFLEQYRDINLRNIEREQQEEFRNILFSNGLFEESLELSQIVYEQNKEDEEAIEGYVHNLMYLDKKDDALLVLYNAQKTAPILFLEAMIYKYDGLYEIAETKLIQARNMTTNKMGLFNIDKELVSIYLETGRANEAREMSEKVYREEPSFENFRIVFENLFSLGLFEEAIDFYKENGTDYEDASLFFSVAFAYNQLEDIENSKTYLLKTIDIDRDYQEAYLHLGHMSTGEQAINYLEKYIEMQGTAITSYIHLISLYSDNKEYDKIKVLMQNVLKEMGVTEETLYISITALKKLYEYEKVYDIYNENYEIKEDPSLLSLALNTLSEEEDYIDFVKDECLKYFDFLADQPHYYETLKNVYELTGNPDIARLQYSIENMRGIEEDN